MRDGSLVTVRVLSDESHLADERGSVVTIGVFDGVHRGHQAIVDLVVREAHRRGLAATVVTFDPHPARVLDVERAPLQLETLTRRLARLALLGVDQVRVIGFDDAASHESAHSFVQRVLVQELDAAHVIVGEDFRFGRDRVGDVSQLHTWGRDHAFSVDAVAAVGDGHRFSSTTARAHVQRGDLRGAEAVLGHCVVLDGVVVHGDGRGGGELGFPTANLFVEPYYAQPGDGVYAGAARLGDGTWHAAAVSVGRRPQFYESGEVTLEAFLLDFSGDLYDQHVALVYLDFLRGEARFDTVDDLVAQMHRDVARTREIFTSLPENYESLLEFFLVQRR